MKRHTRMLGKKRQSGVAAIEFAIVFPVFFLVLYALIGYAFVFLIQSGLQSLASESARQAAAISTMPLKEVDISRDSLIDERIEATINASWLERFDVRQLDAADCGDALPASDGGRLVVCLGADYPLPILNLLGISIPGTPDPLKTHASVFLD
ncbi:TadE-like protein [Chromohalobacter marismortui]|uniref:TadE-like protein n=1 Tax=Chromohalobacter marismortui TaxID=42055 RepID=A0A4V3F4G3_9GAMM|nr:MULTISPECIES: TadE/TadG family type IV pilus assembly protein [Chromohalobacter]MCI0510309.1 pilus assembly protein [Chromohalobacter sp.]MCI0594004.1 pilus assembly protein [Chromohalobacter sp.]TDU25116.1 TadE-like protein [Chromohalobacter marismortui]